MSSVADFIVMIVAARDVRMFLENGVEFPNANVH
jgi:hypothetical protein